MGHTGVLKNQMLCAVKRIQKQHWLKWIHVINGSKACFFNTLSKSTHFMFPFMLYTTLWRNLRPGETDTRVLARRPPRLSACFIESSKLTAYVNTHERINCNHSRHKRQRQLCSTEQTTAVTVTSQADESASVWSVITGEGNSLAGLHAATHMRVSCFFTDSF